jgi:radical SAM protein with 4Fe4S-binding SPASM domain
MEYFVQDLSLIPVRILYLQHVRCPAGTTKLTVMPDGTVYPCYLLARHDEFMLGNMFYDDFEKIWKNPILDFFRNFEKNNCINTNCELFSSCHGGCPLLVS